MEKFTKYFIYFITFIVAFCSLAYELVYSQLLTVLLGGTVLRYSITIGLYMFFLGVGVFAYNYFFSKDKNQYLYFFLLELILSFVGILGAFYMVYISTLMINFSNHDFFLTLIIHLPIIIVGFLSGMELPFLANFIKNRKNFFSETLGFDYFGSLFAAITYPLLLYPLVGLFSTIILIGFLNFIVAGLFLFYFKKKINNVKTFGIITITILIVFIFVLFNLYTINDKVEKFYFGNEINGIYKSFDIPNSKINVTNVYTTQYQKAIFYTLSYGENGRIMTDECMNIDSQIQMCRNWVGSYHNGLIDVPMGLFNVTENISVLLIGGGDWIPLNYLRKYNVNVDMVDIDKDFYTYTKSSKLLKDYHNDSFKYEKLSVYDQDAFYFLKKNTKKYDLIILDLPGVMEDKLVHLYSREFYMSVKKSMKDTGFTVLWAYPDYGRFSDHSQIFLSTLKSAGFNDYMKYQSYNDNMTTETYYILKNNDDYYANINLNNSQYLKDYKDKYQNLSWEKIIYNESYRPNTIFKSNPDVIVKYE